jgi:hypothetical protein
MSRRAPLLRIGLAGIALLGIVGVAAWWIFSDSSRVAVDSPSATSPRSEPRAPSSAEIPAAADEQREAAGRPLAAPPIRESTPLVGPGQFLVEVIDAATRLPVDGARVSWLLEARKVELGRNRSMSESYLDECDFLDEFGESTIADAHGRAVIPRPAGPTDFAAESATGWAYRQGVHAEKLDEVTLELLTDDSIRVQVVDRAGRPVPDVAVAFGAHGGNLGEQSRRARTRAPDGIALLNGISQYVKWFTGRSEWCVQLLVPDVDAPWAPVDPAHLPTEPIVLTLPEGGSMTFTFVDREEKQVDVPLDVHVMFCPHVETSPSGSRSYHSTLVRRIRVEHGRLDLPVVAPGLDCFIACDMDDETLVQEPPLVGPARIGEHLDVSLRTELGPVRFQGRLFDEREEPLWLSPIELRLVRPPSRRNPKNARKQPPPVKGDTDRSGRFDLPIPVFGPLDENLELELRVTLRDGSIVPLSRSRSGTRRADVVDLGELHLSGK